MGKIIGKITKNRLLSISLIVAAALILIAILVGIGIKNKNVFRQDANAHNTNVHYVLVNEDNGATFNNKRYNLGQDFIKLVSQDNKHKWQTAPFDVAQAGMRNGTYDVEIVIPRDFSTRILSLQSTSPKKAGITYRVRKGQNEITNQAVGRKVDGLINDFNNRVVRMYFSSLIGNLRAAQIAMGGIANQQGLQANDLANQVQQPFNSLNDQFASIFGTASILDQTNSADDQADNDFVSGVRDMLDGLGKSTVANNEANSKAIKSLRSQLTKQVNAYENLSSQWSTSSANLQKYFSGDSPMKNFTENLSALQDQLKTNQQSLAVQVTALSEQYQAMLKLQRDLEEEYGVKEGQTAANVIKIEDELTGQAESKNATKAMKDFTNSLSSQINNLAVATDMTNGKVDTQSNQSKADYNNAVAVLRKYSRTVGANYGSQQTTFVNGSSDHSFTNRVTFGLKAGTNTIALSGDGITANLDTDSIRSQLSSQGFKVDDISDFTNNQMTVSFSPKSSADSTSESSSSDNTTATSNDSSDKNTADQSSSSTESSKADSTKGGDGKVVVTSTSADESTTSNGNAYVTVNVRYTYRRPASYSWTVNGSQQNTGNIQQMTGDAAAELNQNVNSTIAAAKEVASVYGKGQSLASFAAAQNSNVIKATNGSLAQLTQAPAKRSTTGDVHYHAQQLAKQYDQVCEQTKKLGQAVGLVKVDSSTPQSIKSLNQISLEINSKGMLAYMKDISGILDWYNQVQKEINKGAEENSQPSDAGKMQPDSSDTDTNMDVADDDDNDLTKQYQDLQKSIEDSTKSLNDTKSQEAKGIQPAIKDLSDNTNKLQQKTNAIRDNLSQNVKDSQRQANNNQDYAQAFNNVMQNARNGEADNSKVYNFLTNPIKATGSYSQVRQQSIIPYFMTLIGAFVSLFVGLAIAKYLPGRKLTEETALEEHTRPWLNLPSALITFAISIGLGLVFALATFSVADKFVRVDWIVYTTVIMALLTSSVAAGARHFRTATLYVSGIIFGLYLLLTPFLGILVRSGSFIRVLYQLSPLQNIETGYTVMMNGGLIGVTTIIVLITAGCLVLAASFYLKPLPTVNAKPAEDKSDED